jgi:predicted DNA-binding protein
VLILIFANLASSPLIAALRLPLALQLHYACCCLQDHMGQRQSTINIEAVEQEIQQLRSQEAPLSLEQKARLDKLNQQLGQYLEERARPVPWPILGLKPGTQSP